MSEVLSFPGLGWELSINRVAFTIGSKPIYWYGVIFALAFLVGTMFVLWRAPKMGINSDRALDAILGSFVAGIICARLYYVAFSWDIYKDNPISILYIWEGGIGFYGGIIGAFVLGFFLCKWRKVKLAPMLDVAGPALLIAQAIGRWGNFVNMEAFGANTTMPWGMTSPTIKSYLAAHAAELGSLGMAIDPNMPVHPTFFYESAWNFIGFLLIGFWLINRRKYDGQMFITYLTWYGAGRFVIEGLRTDSLMIGSIRVSQAVALLCVIAGIIVLAVMHNKMKSEEFASKFVLFSDTEEGRLSATGEFFKLSAEEQAKVRARDNHLEIAEEAPEQQEEAAQPEQAAKADDDNSANDEKEVNEDGSENN